MNKPAIERIINVTCNRFAIEPRELQGRKLPRRLAQYRFVVFAMIQKHLGLKLYAIGALFKMEHTSVLHGIRVVNNELMHNPVWRADIEYIDGVLSGSIEPVVEPVIVEPAVVPVVVEPKAREPVGYAATISKAALETITDSESARTDHRRMWFDFAAWKIDNPLSDFIEAKAEPAGRPTRAARIDRSDPTDDERKCFDIFIREAARDAGLTPTELMTTKGRSTHPGRRLAITRAIRGGIRIVAVAKILGATVEAVKASMRTVETDAKLNQKLERMKAMVAA